MALSVSSRFRYLARTGRVAADTPCGVKVVALGVRPMSSSLALGRFNGRAAAGCPEGTWADSPRLLVWGPRNNE